MTLSSKAKTAALAPQTGEREVCLLTITHPDWSEPILLSTDATEYLENDSETDAPIFGTVSRGNKYYYLPISAVLPDSRDETPPAAKMSIDNVSRYVAPYLLRASGTPPKVTVEVVLASTPDVVDQIWPELELSQADIDASRVEATLGMDTMNSEPLPWLRFVPAYFPNLFD